MNAIRIFFGSVIVYFVVATVYGCSGTRSTSTTAGTAGRGGSGGGAGGHGGHGGAVGTGGASGHGGGSSGGPVANANADESGTRLKAQSIVGADGSKHYLGLYDSSLKVTCDYATMSDGNLHCVPTQMKLLAELGSLYSDSGCTVPLATAVMNGCVPTYIVSNVAQSNCAPATTHVFAVGPAFTSTFYQGYPGNCNQWVGAPTAPVYQVGAEMPPSAFVSGTLTTAP
jgi:hypothetical protein